MKTLILSPAAAGDVDAIWDYTAERWNPDQAELHADAIRDACGALASGRKRGRPVDAQPGYLRCAVGAHMIFFRETEDRVEVIRVLHQRMDVEVGLGE